jgi:predicted transcriptional regulator of viral defense system
MKKKFLEKLKKIDKEFFTLSDLRKIWQGKENSLKVVLSRLAKKGEIKRIYKNFYVLPERVSNLEKIANQIYFPSYLSFESALSKYGILSQIPYTLTFVTPLKTKSIKIFDFEIDYRKLKKELFFGFKKEKEIFIALPEKAILDTLYFISLSKLEINLKNLDFSKIKKERLILFSKKFPQKTKNLLSTLFNF